MNKNLDSSLAVFNAHHSCLRATTSAYSYGTVIHTPACCFSQSVRAAGEYFDCGLLSARRSQQIRGPADRGNHGWTVGLSETKGGVPLAPGCMRLRASVILRAGPSLSGFATLCRLYYTRFPLSCWPPRPPKLSFLLLAPCSPRTPAAPAPTRTRTRVGTQDPRPR